MSDMEQSLNRSSRKVVCKHNKTGFCKFGGNCRNRHINKTCENLDYCREFACTKRHPKMCKSLAKFGKCRFKDDCAYQHNEQMNLNKQTNKSSSCKLKVQTSNGNQYDPTRNEPIESCDTEYGRQNEEL